MSKKVLRAIEACITNPDVAIKKAKRAVKRKSKAKQPVSHAESLAKISESLAEASKDVITPTLQPPALMAMLANIFSKEFRRVSGIEE